MRSPQIIPSGSACGAELRGIDPAVPGPFMAEALQQALREHLAVVVRDRALDDAQLLVFAGLLGTPEEQGISVLTGDAAGATAAQMVASSAHAPARPTGSLGGGAGIWQSDLAYRLRPCSIAILHARALAGDCGTVAFANQYQAYDTLPAELKARVEGRMLLHDESHDNEGRLREGHEDISDPRESTGAQHRIVRTHPETRRKALYLGRRRNAWVIGLPLDESEALLDALWAHATQPALQWRHAWRSGDTLLWDNRCLLYCHDVAARTGREFLRVQLRGEPPR
ncbi:MAG: TauD/TfdA family dioxygenase [Burkholderiales bacterium]|nr:TauD/TfdA family dioxygenase [Burkholderiales bacterium]